MANIANRVFTREAKPIKNIRTAFERARKVAGIEDVVIHDFRHTAITNWIVRGIPQEVVMKASGHKSLAMQYRYVNLGERQIKQAFEQLTRDSHTAVHLDEAASLSY